MYHRVLHIAAFTQDAVLEQELRALAPLEQFEHEIRVEKLFSLEALQWADIGIMETPLPFSFAELRTWARQDAKLICCIDPTEEENFSVEDINYLDDVWLRPVRAPRVRLRMENLLREIKQNCDARLYLNWLNTLIDSMPDLVWFKDTKGAHLKVNDSFCRAVGKTKKQIEGRGHYYIWDLTPDDYAKEEFICLESETVTMNAGKTCFFDEKVKLKQGMRQFKTYKSPLFDSDGKILGTVGFAHDVTNLRNMDIELEILISSMPFPLLLCEKDGNITRLNQRFIEFFGEKKTDILGVPFEVWKEKTLDTEVSSAESYKYARLKNGDETRFVHIVEADLRDFFGSKVGQLYVFRDVTAEKLLEAHMWRNANTDALTGLANRHAFEEFILEKRKQSLLHLFYIDLDNFKIVNDQYGHQMGDEALKTMAQTIRDIFPQDFPVRLGGDEFLVCVLREVSNTELEQLAAQLLEHLEQKFRTSNILRCLSCSIGIIANGAPSTPIEQLIRQADMAMYEAKKNGKARYCIRNHNDAEKMTELQKQ